MRFLNAVLMYSTWRKPARSAMVGIGRSVSVSNCLTRSVRVLAIISWGVKPRMRRNRLSSTRARQWHGRQQVGHVNAVAGVLADEADGAGHLRIVDGQHVGRLTRGDAERRHQMGFFAELFTIHHAVQDRGGPVSGSMRVGHDA